MENGWSVKIQQRRCGGIAWLKEKENEEEAKDGRQWRHRACINSTPDGPVILRFHGFLSRLPMKEDKVETEEEGEEEEAAETEEEEEKKKEESPQCWRYWRRLGGRILARPQHRVKTSVRREPSAKLRHPKRVDDINFSFGLTLANLDKLYLRETKSVDKDLTNDVRYSRGERGDRFVNDRIIVVIISAIMCRILGILVLFSTVGEKRRLDSILKNICRHFVFIELFIILTKLVTNII